MVQNESGTESSPSKHAGKRPPADAEASAKLVVFYDGECAMCSGLAEECRLRDTDARTEWVDYNTAGDRLAGYGITPGEARTRIHAAGADGKIHHSIGALRAVWREIPRYRFLAFLAGVPVLSGLLDRVYGFAAARRNRIRPAAKAARARTDAPRG